MARDYRKAPRWTNEQKDAAADVGPRDKERADERWKEDVGPRFANLLEAEPTEEE